jgi:CheY-like chemotaxis protein
LTAVLNAPGRAAVRPLGDVVGPQLRAIDAFVAARQAAAVKARAGAGSREDRMDLDRRLGVFDTEQQALLARLDEQLAGSGDVLQRIRPTALIAHRHEWFVRKVTELLGSRGVDVVGSTMVGPEAVGWAVADQPDIAIVDETLAMLHGEHVVREIRQFCPQTIIAAQVGYSDSVGRMLEAGASCVHVRAVPPAVVVEQIVGVLTA